ncbi:MAG: hypothetical protein ACLFWB_05810 [Armatimonadota bacterium]
MNKARVTCIIIIALCLAAAGQAEIVSPQSKPWRVGIVGGWTLGYLGILAHHGMPGERILESEILDPQRLAKYDCVIIGYRSQRSQDAWEILEDYVREGGLVVTEAFPTPSEDAIPGERLKPGRVPNVTFVDSIGPITRGLDYDVIIRTFRRHGCAIIPEENTGTTVIARYTYDQIPPKYRDDVDDHFVEKRKDSEGNVREIGAPAIVMRHVGRGILVYSGCPIGLSLSLQGDYFTPLLLNLLRYVSKGEIHERFYTGDIPRNRLLTANLQQFEPSADTLPPPPETTELPDGGETVQQATAPGEDYYAYGTLTDAQAEIIFDWRNAEEHRKITIAGENIEMMDISGGQARTVVSETLPESATGGDDCVLRHRGQVAICYLNGQPVLSACPGPPQGGAVGVKGLQETGFQPSAPVYFFDDFMRESDSHGEWETLSGTWKEIETEGKAERGANPFQYVGESQSRAMATTGHWFWQDYAFSASVNGSGTATGLLFDFQDEKNWSLLRLQHPQSDSEGRLEVIRCLDGRETKLAEATCPVPADQWAELQVLTSGTHIIGRVDGSELIAVRDDSMGFGAIGLMAEKGAVCFDDIVVEPWFAGCEPAASATRTWDIRNGEWGESENGVITGTGKALLPAGTLPDARVSSQIRLNGADFAGLYLRHSEQQDGLYLAGLMPKDGGLGVRIFARSGDDGQILAEEAIPGAVADWHEVTFSARGPLLELTVNGARAVSVVHDGSLTGRVGLYSRGDRPAEFRELSAASLRDDTELVDGLVPEFAGIIDRRTWASRPGAWQAEPENLNRFWHSGFFPGPIVLHAGIHPLGNEETTTHLFLTNDRSAEKGYEVESVCSWENGTASIALKAAEQTVGAKTVQIPAKKAYLLSLHRRGGCVWVEVNGRLAVGTKDTVSDAGLEEIGVSNEGHKIVPADLAVYTPWARNYTFETAPTDWVRHSGTWEVTNRWSCSPQWTWFCGYNGSGPAEVSSKIQFENDFDLTFYVAARMMPRGDGKHYEQLRDIHIGLCTGPNGAADGYEMKVGGHRNQYTSIERKGKEVKRIQFRIPQVAIHNDWMQLGVRKRGGTIQLLHWGQVIMEYDDPTPPPPGGVSLGTHENGIIIPRLTAYGEITAFR